MKDVTISGEDSVTELIEFSNTKTDLTKLFRCMSSQTSGVTLLTAKEPYVMNRVKNFVKTP